MTKHFIEAINEILSFREYFDSYNLKLKALEYENQLEGDPVIYQFNNYGFRCDDFVVGKKDILFSGCSITNGDALPLDYTWSKKMYDHILKDKGYSGYHSLAKSGNSYKKIVFDIINYCKHFGNPESVFVLFPNTPRFQEWREDGFFHPECLKTDSKQIPEYFLDAFYSIIMLEQYCKSNGIKLYWSTWDEAINEAVVGMNVGVERYVPTKLWYFDEYQPSTSYYLFARDREHPGSKFHQEVFECFLKAYEEEL